MEPPKYSLDEKELQRVVDRYLKGTQVMEKTVAQDHPVLVLVAGQPGAGKTGTSKGVKDALRGRGGYVHLDADRMREDLPAYQGFFAQYGEKASEITQAASGQAVARLRAVAVEARRNIVEEGTLRAGSEVFSAYTQKMQSVGYRVEVRAMAVAPEESRLGIYQRYEGQISSPGVAARFVPDDYHDQTCAGLLSTVRGIEKLVDRVVVVNRKGETLHDSLAPTNAHRSAAEAIEAGRTLDAQGKAQVALGWDAVHMQAVKRGAEKGYLERVRLHQGQAHLALRKDMLAAKIYDAASPESREFSRALAKAHGSQFRQIFQDKVADMKKAGCSANDVQKATEKALEKLADTVSQSKVEPGKDKAPGR